MSGTTSNPSTEVSVAARISNHVVRLMSSYTGRGPTKAWTSMSDDLITTVLRDTLTKGEQSLVSDSRAELVLSMRKAFHDRMRHDLVAGVEQITGRRVIAFLSDNHIDPDIAIECFVLQNGAEPAQDAPSAMDGG